VKYDTGLYPSIYGLVESSAAMVANGVNNMTKNTAVNAVSAERYRILEKQAILTASISNH
jgi:hypothetical protein